MAVDPIVVVDDGLGNTTSLVDLGDGPALAVDSSRDLLAVQQAAQAVGWRSPSRQTRTCMAASSPERSTCPGRRCSPRPPAVGGTRTGLRDGDEVDLGDLPLPAPAPSRACRSSRRIRRPAHRNDRQRGAPCRCWSRSCGGDVPPCASSRRSCRHRRRCRRDQAMDEHQVAGHCGSLADRLRRSLDPRAGARKALAHGRVRTRS